MSHVDKNDLDAVRNLLCEMMRCTSVSVCPLTFANMSMVGDVGADIDVCSAVALLRIGVVHRMSFIVVADTGDLTMRAGLVKGTLQASGA